MEFRVRYLVLFCLFFSSRWFREVLDGKSSQEYPINARVPRGSILDSTFFLLCINDLPDDVNCNIAICADNGCWAWILSPKHYWLMRKWLIHFNAGKAQLVWFDRSNNIGAVNVKIYGLLFRKNHLLRWWGCLFLLNWIWALHYLYC